MPNWWWEDSRWWWRDNEYALRYYGAHRRRLIRRIKRYGLPCVIRYRRKGNLICLEITPRRGWTHLSNVATRKELTGKGYKYNVTVAMRNQVENSAPEDGAAAAVALVQQDFLRPKKVRLRVARVQTNHVAVLRITPIFAGCIANLRYLRAWFSNHEHLPDPSISM